MKVVTAEQMRAIEQRSEAAGVSTAELMEHAGRSVADEAILALADPAGRHVLVLVGPGNNGGDGLVAARHLHDAGAQVALYLWHRDTTRDRHYETAVQRGIPIVRAEDDSALAVLLVELARAALILDGLLGTGRARPAAGLLKAILDTVNGARGEDSTLLAIDLPTGLDADTGAVDESCLRAEVTVTLGFPKVGLFALPGAEYVGRLVVGDIGLPPGLADDVQTEVTTAEDVRALLPARPAGAHKGTFGKVMVVGGSPQYIGAPALACRAAGRVGAGLVTLACAQPLLPIFAAKLTENTFAPLPEAAPGILGGNATALLDQLADYNALLVGPGLGRHAATQAFVVALLGALKTGLKPAGGAMRCVVDADGLNALAAQPQWWTGVAKDTILTPHSGEMARLSGMAIEQVEADRLASARAAAGRWGVVVVLKGPFTIIAAPDGRVNINPSANAALATAGTGDVLSGAIAGLLAQGLAPFHAAVLGVYLHAEAGELAREELGDAGVLAGDLLPLLPRAIKQAKE